MVGRMKDCFPKMKKKHTSLVNRWMNNTGYILCVTWSEIKCTRGGKKDEVLDERGNVEKNECLLYETKVSVCDLIPEFMSFVSLDCTYTGRKIHHRGTQMLFIFLFNACLYLYLSLYLYISIYLYRYIYIYTQYILTNLMLMRFSAPQRLICLFTVYMWKMRLVFVSSLSGQ